jgi:hypothetical protein
MKQPSPHHYTTAFSEVNMTMCERCREQWGLPMDAFVYVCFSRPEKIDRGVFSVWMSILKRTPGSVLWVSSACMLHVPHHITVYAKPRCFVFACFPSKFVKLGHVLPPNRLHVACHRPHFTSCTLQIILLFECICLQTMCRTLPISERGPFHTAEERCTCFSPAVPT